MSTSQVLREISDRIRQLLVNGLDIDSSRISLGSPTQVGDGNGSDGEISDPLLSLYLYQLLPQGQLNNQTPIPNSRGDRPYPPLNLNLYYLLTPLENNPESSLLTLGSAMQVLAAAPMIQASFLESTLLPSPPEARLTLNPLPLEEVTRIWSAFNQPYRLSVCYKVQGVSMDSIRLPRSETPVQEPVLDVHQIL